MRVGKFEVRMMLVLLLGYAFYLTGDARAFLIHF